MPGFQSLGILVYPVANLAQLPYHWIKEAVLVTQKAQTSDGELPKEAKLFL